MRRELMVSCNPKSELSEAIKNVRTNLQFSSIDEPIKNILITSSTSGEGKSFICANLAIAFANLNSKVLIVDCDLRRGRQHELFEVSNIMGLSNLLIDDVENNYKKYIQKTEIKNIDILTRGVIPPNASELLASEKNKQLMNVLNQKYDIIIWDGTPVLGLSDSIIMSSLVDKIVLVCAYKQTPFELLKEVKNKLTNFESKISGVIMNKMVPKGSKYVVKYYTED